MFRIAVCDDNDFFRDHLKLMIEEYGRMNQYQLDVYTYRNGEAFLEDFNRIAFNILFLDIDMGSGITGIDTAQKIRKRDKDIVIIFVTSHDEYAIDAFGVSALQYLIKPVKVSQLEDILGKSLKQIQVNQAQKLREQDYMVIRTVDATYTVRKEDIYYISKCVNWVIYHTSQGDLYSYDTIKHLSLRLNPQEFIQINQGMLVNWGNVESLSKNKVVVKGKELTVTKTYQAAIQEHCKKEVMMKARDILWET